MNLCRLATLAVILLFTSSCNDNLFYFGTDTTSTAAANASIDIAFIQGNSSFVKAQYDAKVAAGEVLTNEMDRYKYAAAILANSGYNIIGSLEYVLGKPPQDNATIAVDMMFAFIGTKEVTIGVINTHREYYTQVLNQCTGVKNESFKLLCGFAAASDTVMAIAFASMSIIEVNTLPATQADLRDALIKASGTTLPVTRILNFLNGYVAKNTTYLPSLTRNYYQTDAAITIMQRLLADTTFLTVLKSINENLLASGEANVVAIDLVLVISDLIGLN